MPARDIIVIGASAGGLQAIIELARELPSDLPASLFVVIHSSPSAPGLLPKLVDSAGPLWAAYAEHGEAIRHGRIYIAPPDQHLMLEANRIQLSRGPKENGFRPAADPLFRSAANAFEDRVVGIVLSGGLDGGTAGLQQIKRQGGLALVQDPDTAVHASMPDSAIRNVRVDRILPVPQMGAVLAELARDGTAKGGTTMPHRKSAGEPDTAKAADVGINPAELPGAPSGFVCPECGGALWELTDGKLVKYRCHVGHVFTSDALLTEKVRDLENALWTALRALDENAALYLRIAKRVADAPIPSLSREYERRAEDAEERAALVRQVLFSDEIRKPGTNSRPAPRTTLSKKLAKKARAKKK